MMLTVLLAGALRQAHKAALFLLSAAIEALQSQLSEIERCHDRAGRSRASSVLYQRALALTRWFKPPHGYETGGKRNVSGRTRDGIMRTLATSLTRRSRCSASGQRLSQDLVDALAIHID